MNDSTQRRGFRSRQRLLRHEKRVAAEIEARQEAEERAADEEKVRRDAEEGLKILEVELRRLKGR